MKTNNTKAPHHTRILKRQPAPDGKQRRAKQDKPKPFGLPGLLEHFGITRWDAIMIGDGSGSTFQRGCGWGTLLFIRHDPIPRFFCGSFSHGTNNVAEIMAYFQPLLWYSSSQYRGSRDQERDIHIVTDSEYVAGTANNPESRKKHKALWGGFDQYRRQGIFLHWHWLRSGLSLHNLEADALSREARVQMEGFCARHVQSIEQEYQERSRKQERQQRRRSRP